MQRNRTFFAALSACIALSASSASAAFIEIGSPMGVMSLDSNAVGIVTPTGPDSFNWTGSMNNAVMGWAIDWNLTIDTDPQISGVSAFTSLLPTTSNFTFNISASSTIAIANPQVNGASVLSLIDTNGDGASMSALTGSSIYDAFISSTTQQALFTDPFSLIAPPAGFDQAGFSWGPQAATAPLNNGDLFGINHSFSLSAFDQATVNSSFFIIPTPASFGVLALGGAIIARRRRA